MDYYDTPLEQMVFVAKEALETIRDGPEGKKNNKMMPREELLKIAQDALRKMEAIEFNAEYHHWYLYCSDKM